MELPATLLLAVIAYCTLGTYLHGAALALAEVLCPLASLYATPLLPMLCVVLCPAIVPAVWASNTGERDRASGGQPGVACSGCVW